MEATGKTVDLQPDKKFRLVTQKDSDKVTTDRNKTGGQPVMKCNSDKTKVI